MVQREERKDRLFLTFEARKKFIHHHNHTFHSFVLSESPEQLPFVVFFLKSNPHKMKFSFVAVVSFVSVANAFTAPKSSFLGRTSISQNAVASGSNLDMKYKVAVVGGGPSGACAAEIFAQEKGIDTVMFERKLDNAKPCGGAIPLCMIGEFDIPESVVDRKVRRITVRDILEPVRL
jgi:hypothetical protein